MHPNLLKEIIALCKRRQMQGDHPVDPIADAEVLENAIVQLSDALGPERARFARGDFVRKRSGSQWQGRVVGEYSTTLTPEGYAVESDTHAGSVQIYPAAALELLARSEPPNAELRGRPQAGPA